MPRIPIVTEAHTPEKSKQMLDAVASQIDKAPNMVRREQVRTAPTD